MWPVLRRVLLALVACLVAQASVAQQAPLAPANPSFQGPGSPGFLPTCQGNFSVTNYVLGTGNTQIGAAPWGLTPVGGASAPTLGSTTDIAPDGSATAVDVNFASIANNTQASVLTEGVGTSVFNVFYNWTQQVWVKVVTPPASGYFSVAIYDQGSANRGPLANGKDFVSTPIPNDGKWHLITNYIPANWSANTGPGHTAIFEIGPDGRDSTQPSAVSSGTVAVWEPQYAQGYSEGGKGWPFVPNPSTTNPSAPTEFTLQCPPTIAFRDWSAFKPWISSVNNAHGISQITVQHSAAPYATPSGGLYEQGGLGNPFVAGPTAHQYSGPYAGKDCGFSSTTDGTVNATNHNNWPASVLFCGSGRNPFSYQEAQPGSPQLLVPGFTLATASTNTSGGLSPCSSGCLNTTAVSVASTSVSVNASTGVVTITLPSAINPGPGANIAVSGYTGAAASIVNGNFMAIAPTGGGTTTITYQSSCTTSCATALNAGNGSIFYSVPWNSYTLHGWWLPQITTGPNAGTACTVNSVSYKFCPLFSAEASPNGGGVPNAFLGYSNTIDSGYCVYNQFFPSHCNNGSPTAPDGGTSPNQPTGIMTSANANVGVGQLPTVICLPVGCPAGATLYAIGPASLQSVVGMVLWQATAGVATSWTYAGWVTQPPFASASFTGSISGGTSLVASSVTGVIQPGQTISGSGVLPGTVVLSGPNAGGAGTYVINQSQTASGSMTSTWPALDWDASASRIDPAIYPNRCGFFEFFGTSFRGSSWQPPTGGTGNKKNQDISYRVSTDIRGPYYALNNAYWAPVGDGSGHVTGGTGAILPFTSPLYNGLTTIGETNAWDDPSTGNLYLTFNTDSGNTTSSGVGGYMPDACQ